MRWFYNLQTQRWKAMSNGWQATVIRVVDGDTWFGVIERRTPSHHEQYKSVNFEWAQQARSWCETEIAARNSG